jgi:N-formylglutamate amidohydrolase
MDASFCELTLGAGPLVATAIHDGHALRDDVAARIALSDAERLREEDPHTGAWAALAPTRLVVRRSRFEVDLNRPREKCVYRCPEDAWGLRVWREEPPEALVRDSLAAYDAFYAELARIESQLAGRHGRFVVFDLHSYNHRRAGPGGAPADPAANPDVNVGTGSLADRRPWAPLIDRFVRELGGADVGGRRLDVRENVRFRGGQLPRWMHENFPDSACCLAVEVKKFFMDEWSGRLSAEEFEAVPRALESTLPGLRESLEKIARSER